MPAELHNFKKPMQKYGHQYILIYPLYKSGKSDKVLHISSENGLYKQNVLKK